MKTQVEVFARNPGLLSSALQLPSVAPGVDFDGDDKNPDTAVKLYHSLGMEFQAAIFETGVRIAGAQKSFPVLSPYCASVLQTAFPTAYSYRVGGWKGYKFDLVPIEVAKILLEVKEKGTFDDLQIWTPEIPVPVPRPGVADPFVVGRIRIGSSFVGFVGDEFFFPIARWGEALKSFQEIEIEVLQLPEHAPGVVLETLRGLLNVRKELHARMYGGRSLFFSYHGFRQERCAECTKRRLSSVLAMQKKNSWLGKPSHPLPNVWIFRSDFGLDSSSDFPLFISICENGHVVIETGGRSDRTRDWR